MRILIVNPICIGDANATGITMHNILMGIPDVDYLQFCLDYNTENIHAEEVRTFFFSEKQIPLQRMRTSLFGQKDKRTDHAVLPSNAQLSWKRELLRGIMDCSPFFITRKQWEIIRSFHPDMIYTQIGGSIRICKTVHRISSALDIPVVFHCMDDWRNVIYTSSKYVKPFNAILKRWLVKIQEKSKCGLAICEKMARMYEYDFHIPYFDACNCTDTYNEKSYKKAIKSPLLVIYSGGLHHSRDESLVQVAKLIDEMNVEGTLIEMEAFVPAKQQAAFQSKFSGFQHTRLLEYVPMNEQMSNLMRADILLHVESWEPEEIEYFKLSFSTKLVEYFSAHRAVIAFGDKSISSIEYVNDNLCGWGVSTIQDLKSALEEAFSCPERCEYYADHAYQTLITKHTRKVVQEKVRNAFLMNIPDKVSS